MQRLDGVVHRLAAFPHRQGRGSPGASKSEDITIALATSFDASGWNTARHLVRPRWVIGRSHTVNSSPLISLRQTLGQGLAFILGASRVRRVPHQGAPAHAGLR